MKTPLKSLDKQVDVAPFATDMQTAVYYQNDASSYAPLLVLVSHFDNAFESQAAEQLIYRMNRLFGKDVPTVKVVSPQNSVASLHGELLDYVREHSKSAVITLNPWLAEALAHDTRARNYLVPHLFAGMHDVSNFEGLDIAHAARDLVTGVVTKHPSYENVLSLTQDVYSDFSRALFITNPDQDHGRSAQMEYGVTKENLALCERMGIEPVPFRVRSPIDIETRLEHRLERGRDIIFTGLDNLALSSGGMLSAIAEMHQVPVITQSPEMVKRGHAMFGIGSGCEQTASVLARRLYKILVDGERPGDIPLLVIKESSRVAYHPDLLNKQGAQPSPEMLRALQAYSIYDRAVE